MNKVFTYFDFVYDHPAGYFFRGTTCRFKPDAPTTKQTLIVLAIRRTKHFCPDVMRTIALHLWSMRQSSEMELVIPQTGYEVPGNSRFDMFIEEHCARLDDDTIEHVFFRHCSSRDDFGDPMYSRVIGALPNATFISIPYDEKEQLAFNALKTSTEKLACVVNYIKK